MRRFVGSGPCARAVSLALGALSFAGGACAAADGLRTTLGVTTDYVHRGISQTAGRAALQASAAYWHPVGAYGGLWLSNVESPAAQAYPYVPDRAMSARSRGHVEVDLTAGFGKRVTADWILDSKAVAYWYPAGRTAVGYDYVEFSTGAAWREMLHATVAYTPSTTWPVRGARHRPALGLELALQLPVSRWFTAAVGVGHRALDAPGASHYDYGSSRLAMQTHRFSLELGHYATDGRARRLFGGELAGDRTVMTATVSF